jgi:hypothetical protein
MLGETVKTTVLAECSIPHNLVTRQVDNVPIVAPKSSAWCEEYSKKYKNTCQELNIELAPICPSTDKAFENVTKDKVLGILFDSEKWNGLSLVIKDLRLWAV